VRGHTRRGGHPTRRPRWLALSHRDPRRCAQAHRAVRPLTGAALAAWLAAQARPGGEQPGTLVLESAITSVPDLAAGLYWRVPARWLARIEYATRDHLAEVHCPVLVVHSPEEEIIPYAHGRALYEAAPPPRSLLELHGDHNTRFLVSGEVYVRGLDAFLSASLPVPEDPYRQAQPVAN
jgi:pimeloyl-ACP methyl ester carboxylesterase